MFELYDENPIVMGFLSKYIENMNPLGDLDDLDTFGIEVNLAVAKDDGEYSVGINVSVADEDGEIAACGEAVDDSLMKGVLSAVRMLNINLDEESEKAIRESVMTEELNSLYTDRELLDRRIYEMEEKLGLHDVPF